MSVWSIAIVAAICFLFYYFNLKRRQMSKVGFILSMYRATTNTTVKIPYGIHDVTSQEHCEEIVKQIYKEPFWDKDWAGGMYFFTECDYKQNLEEMEVFS
jgi:hypothetical protein